MCTMANENLWTSELPKSYSRLKQYATDPNSLTARLVNTGLPFGVQIRYQGPDEQWPDEHALFEAELGTTLRARHTVLTLDKIPVVVARSLSRYDCPHWGQLHECGSHSLGLTLFDKHRPIERKPFHYRVLQEGHPLFRLARAEELLSPTDYLARRRLFILEGAVLSMCEVFLGGFEKFFTR